MERLIVLGTGNAQAIHCYNTCYAMQKGEEYFLVADRSCKIPILFAIAAAVIL